MPIVLDLPLAPDMLRGYSSLIMEHGRPFCFKEGMKRRKRQAREALDKCIDTLEKCKELLKKKELNEIQYEKA